MHIEIVPFRDTHLEEAAELLALRHQEDHALEPALPDHFKQTAAARAALQATWSKPDASGVVALYAGRMIGYIIGVPRIDLAWGRSVWVYLPGHAVDRTYGAEVYRDLYAALSPSWVALGCFAHYALIPALDQPDLEAWFALSFGKEHAHGIRETAEAPALATPVDPTLKIRRAELVDLDASLELDDIIPRHQSRAPVYAPYWFVEYAPFGNKEEIRQESIEILKDEKAKLWLALRNGRIVGYQLFMPAFPHFDKIDNMMIPEQCSFLGTAAMREEEQGRGVGRALTAHGLAADHAAGYTHCITDWRVTNLLSSRFWPRQGFRPVAYRLSRRLDERIAWAHGGPSPSPWLPRYTQGLRV
ncbi:MAG TPA: GNAT family N-acetyltransferase [Ktedonobacteraceae bacterium]